MTQPSSTRHTSGPNDGLIVAPGYVDAPPVNGQRSRRIVNGAGYLKNGIWLPAYGRGLDAPTTTRIRAGSTHAGYSYSSPEGALQFHCRDAQDTGNRALVRVDVAGLDGAGVSWKAIDCSDSDWEPSLDGNGGAFRNLWDGVDWEWRVGGHIAKDELYIHDLATARVQGRRLFRFSVAVHGNARLEQRANGIHFISQSTGESLGRMSNPVARDANGSDLDWNVRASFVVLGQNEIGIEIDAQDFADAVGFIRIDPTTTISGTSAIEDNFMLNATLAGNNYGGYANTYTIGRATPVVDYRHATIRVLNPSTNIPAGTLLDATFYATRQADPAQSTQPGTMYWYPMKNAATWTEGVSNASVLTGESTWNSLAHPSTAWPGSAGASTKGATDDPTEASKDYDLTPDVSKAYAAYTSGPDVAFNMTFSSLTTWIEFRDGSRTNNGWLIKTDEGVAPQVVNLRYPTEAASGQWYFDVTYTAATSNGNYYRTIINRRRRN